MRSKRRRQPVPVILVLVIGVIAASQVGIAPSETESDRVVVNSLGLELVRVPAGTFVMGSGVSEPGRLGNEGPPHRVSITRPFLIAAHEITVGQFATFVAETGYVTEAERDPAGGFGIDAETGRLVRDASFDWREPGLPGHVQSDDHPVTQVSWKDAEAFCRWLSDREGVAYRLPTEAEWEYACRGGTTTAYWTGDDPASLSGAANVASGPFDDGFEFAAPVGSFAANPLGLYDMHGNVWEWCGDWYDPLYYGRSAVRDPAGPDGGRFRAIRGGSWLDGPLRTRSAQRVYFTPTFRYCALSGFRVVREAG